MNLELNSPILMKICLTCGEKFNHPEWLCPSCHRFPKQINGHLAFCPELAKVSEGFEETFFTQLLELESRNFWFRARNRLIIWAMQRYFPQATNFLEIGCGTGFVLSGLHSAFPHVNLSGSEIFETGLTFAARRLPKVNLFQMDARQIPFAEEFEVIGAFDVLEHIQADSLVLTQMYQAVKSGGGILVTVPQHPWLWSYVDEYSHHVRRYRAEEIKVKIEQAGFKVMRTTSFVSLLLPLMIFSRLRPRASKYEVTAELQIGGWMNTVLEKVLNVERILIRSGISLPLGGSLLVIAKK